MVALSVVLLFLTPLLWSQRKKKKKADEELPNQTLALPQELPNAVAGDTAHLVFHLTPLSNKGLLSQQVRDALRALQRQLDGATVLRLRAFVAGTGDLRRVPAIVSEMFTERRMPLPAVSVVQVGGLPMEGAQVVIEATSMAKKPVNPNGIAFLAARGLSTPNPLDPVLPLAEATIPQFRSAIREAGASEVLAVTCFASALDSQAALLVRGAFPKAAVDVVQLVRAPSRAVFECEAVARLERAPASPVESADGAVRLNLPRLVFTGSQMGFHSQDSDLRLAFQRLDKSLAAGQAAAAGVVFVRFYALTRGVADRVRQVSGEFFSKDRPPASTVVVLEGLPSLDASFGMDVVALPGGSR